MIRVFILLDEKTRKSSGGFTINLTQNDRLNQAMQITADSFPVGQKNWLFSDTPEERMQVLQSIRLSKWQEHII